MKRIFFRKIIFPTGEFLFFNKRLRDIELRVIFWFQKTVLHHKIINKTRSTKDLENSAECFGKNYFTSHLVKFLQDKIKP